MSSSRGSGPRNHRVRNQLGHNLFNVKTINLTTNYPDCTNGSSILSILSILFILSKMAAGPSSIRLVRDIRSRTCLSGLSSYLYCYLATSSFLCTFFDLIHFLNCP